MLNSSLLLDVSAQAFEIIPLTINFVLTVRGCLLAVDVDIARLGEPGRCMIMFRLVLHREIFFSALAILSPWQLMG